MEFEKTLNNHGKIMEFCEIILTKPPVARKLAVGHIHACMVYKHAVVAAFRIYAQCDEDAAKMGG